MTNSSGIKISQEEEKKTTHKHMMCAFFTLKLGNLFYLANGLFAQRWSRSITDNCSGSPHMFTSSTQLIVYFNIFLYIISQRATIHLHVYFAIIFLQTDNVVSKYCLPTWHYFLNKHSWESVLKNVLKNSKVICFCCPTVYTR